MKKKNSTSGKDREIIGKNELPSISRIITDLRFWLSVLSFFLIIVVGFTSFFLYKNIKAEENQEKEKNQIASDIKYWKKVTEKYPLYRDAYYQIAILEYKLGETELFKEYLKKTLELDPNYEPAEKLVNIIK